MTTPGTPCRLHTARQHAWDGEKWVCSVCDDDTPYGQIFDLVRRVFKETDRSNERATQVTEEILTIAKTAVRTGKLR